MTRLALGALVHHGVNIVGRRRMGVRAGFFNSINSTTISIAQNGFYLASWLMHMLALLVTWPYSLVDWEETRGLSSKAGRSVKQFLRCLLSL